MSVSVVNNTITMTRGDTLKVKIDIFTSDNSSEQYIPTEGDRIVFAAKQRYSDVEPAIYKEIPYDTCILHLEPSDTKSLIQPSKYNYEVELTMADGTVDTFLKGILKIVEEVC